MEVIIKVNQIAIIIIKDINEVLITIDINQIITIKTEIVHIIIDPEIITIIDPEIIRHIVLLAHHKEEDEENLHQHHLEWHQLTITIMIIILPHMIHLWPVLTHPMKIEIAKDMKIGVIEIDKCLMILIPLQTLSTNHRGILHSQVRYFIN